MTHLQVRTIKVEQAAGQYTRGCSHMPSKPARQEGIDRGSMII